MLDNSDIPGYTLIISEILHLLKKEVMRTKAPVCID